MTNIKHTYEYVKNYMKDCGGYVLLSNEYKNCRYDKLKIQCPEGHIFYVTFGNFKQGNRCTHSSHNPNRLSYENVKNYITNEGFELLSTTYLNAFELLTLKCKHGHVFTKSFNNFKYNGQRCGECRPKNSSKPEKEVVSFVKSLYSDIIIENDRRMLKNPLTNRPLELDIWLPKIRKAIEFNGEYYHRDSQQTDLMKRKLCNEKNIELLVIMWNDWIKNKNDIMYKIRSLIGVYNNGMVQ